MNVTCSAEPCPVILNATCVFYEGENLIYTGINTNDNLQTALQKIDAKFGDAFIGYIFDNGVIQTAPGQPVRLGGSLVQNTVITSGGYTFEITGSIKSGAFITTGGTSSQFVKGDGSLDSTSYQPAGNYITALTGDGAASGPGSAVFTLTNVNFLPGTYGNTTTIPVVTVNSKGLVTSITNAPIAFPAASLIFNGDVSGAGTTGSIITLTLATVNANVYGTNTALKFAVNGKGLVTSAAPLTNLDIFGIIGYTPVPPTRTITINGVTQNLAANRTWTIDTLPSQTGNSGKYLTTNGTIASWANVTTGTVTSVDMSVPIGLTISGNPITTSGTLALGLQSGYSIPTISDQSNWTTAYNDSIVSAAVTGTATKTLTLNQQDGGTITASWSDIDTGLTSVGLTMPTAFSVANTPLTSNGTLAVTANGTSSQYIRGDGQLATLPSSPSGGGSSISYYLNGSVPASVATYEQMSRNPVFGLGTNFTTSSNGLIAQFLTDVGDPSYINIPGGAWLVDLYFNANSAGGTPNFYVELYKYDGSVFTLIASSVANPEYITNGIAVDFYTTSLGVPTTTLLLTDRLAIRVYVDCSGKTLTLHTENNNLAEIVTTFSTGISALNGLIAQVQFLATGAAGTDFNISSATATHTFNLPTASAANRGALSSTDWTTFNGKQNTITLTTTGSSGSSSFISDVLNIPTYTLSGLGGVPSTRSLTINGTAYDLSSDRAWSVGTVTSVAALTLGTTGTDLSSSVATGTTTPVITLNVPTASASNRGALSSTDWTTFNSKQNTITLTTTGTSGAATFISDTLNIPQYQAVLTNPVTGTGTANELTYWTSSSAIGSLTTATYPSLTELSYVKGVTSAIQTQINGKQDTLTLTTTGTSGAATLIGATLNIPQYTDQFVGTVTSVATTGPITGGTITSTGTIGITQSTTSTDGYLSSTDWNTFNGKFTLPSLTSGSVLFSNGSTIAQDNAQLFWDDSTNRLGIGTATPSAILHSVGSVTAASAIARGNYMQPTLVAAANSDVLVGLDISPTFTNGAFTGVSNFAARFNGNVNFNTSTSVFNSNTSTYFSFGHLSITNTTTSIIGGYFQTYGNLYSDTTLRGGAQYTFDTRNSGAGGFLVTAYNGSTFTSALKVFSTTNIGIGTTTDAGYKLDVNGTARLNGSTTFGTLGAGTGMFWDNTNNRLGIGTATPANTLDVVRGAAGAMGRGVYESASFSFNGDMKFGLYTSAAAGSGGASLLFGATNFTAGGNYPGFEFQFVPSATLASNYIRLNSVGRNATGTVVSSVADILCVFQAGNVAIGTSTNAGYKLDVNGTGRFRDALTIEGNGTITKNQNAATTFTISNTTAGASANPAIVLTADSLAGSGQVFKYSSTRSGYKIIASSDYGFYNATAGDISFLNDFTSGKIKFSAGGSSTAHVTIETTGATTFTKQIISTLTGVATTGAGQIYLNGGTGNRIDFNGNGYAPPSFTTRSTGNKILLFPELDATKVDYAIGIDLSTLWLSIPQATNVYTYKFYGGTTTIMSLNGLGQMVIGSTSPNTSARLQIDSTTQGLLPPRMTNAQMVAIASPAVGLVVYSTDTTEGLYQYTSAGWVNLTAAVTNRQVASYTLVLTDINKLVEMNVATANNLTVPLNSTVAFPIGTKIDVVQYGAGQTTFVATVGVTIRSTNNWLKMNAQYGAATLVKIATDEWYLFGNINA